ncbi:MAG: DNA helicase RecG, partial [Candidatus Omnitrophica bacterium]|nr:DNA helicase RecG [Candidatus Omnitrophota bacterium]
MDIEKTETRYIKSVGPQRQDMLKRLSLSTVADCLYHVPRRYEDRSSIKPIAQLLLDIPQTVSGEITSTSIFTTKSKQRIFQIAVNDTTATIYAMWFNQPYMKQYFNKGDKVIMYGKIQKRT